MASLWLRKPARFYGERALKVSLETLPPQPCEIHHLRKTHFIDECVTSPAIWCLNPTAAHVEEGSTLPLPRQASMEPQPQAAKLYRR